MFKIQDKIESAEQMQKKDYEIFLKELEEKINF